MERRELDKVEHALVSICSAITHVGINSPHTRPSSPESTRDLLILLPLLLFHFLPSFHHQKEISGFNHRCITPIERHGCTTPKMLFKALTILNKMGSNGGEQLNMTGNDTAECSETTVEIKIKTLDSQTFTLRVDKYVPIPQLKEQIASLTGILSEQQHLICRGKVLKDDQRLSPYHVEDGHTLHLIVRQPVVPSPDIFDHPATDSTSGTGHNPGDEVGPGVMVGTFDISEQGDGVFPDLNRIVSAVLDSFGVARSGSGGEGVDHNQPFERLSTAPGLSGTRNYSRVQSGQTSPEAIPVESLQPPVAFECIVYVHSEHNFSYLEINTG